MSHQTPIDCVTGTCIADIVRDGPLPRLENRLLVMHVCGLTHMQLITQDHLRLNSEQADTLSRLFKRRIEGVPMAYLLGEREFYGLTFSVSPDVLIPRPETELLVDLGIKYAPTNAHVLDLGTGSGAIAIALGHTRSDVHLTAVDVSEAALTLARRNATRHRPPPQAPICFLQSHWYDALNNQRFDVILTNPPYIAAHDPHLSQGDLRFEPLGALTEGADGLDAIRHIIKGAPQHLRRPGSLFIEHGYDQADTVKSLLAAQGFASLQSWPDLAGILRVTGGFTSL